MTSDDTDNADDLYERHDGHTSLISPAREPCTLLPSPRCEPEWHGVSADGHRAWLQSDEELAAGDADADSPDVFETRLAEPGSVSVDTAPLAYTQGDPPAAVDPQLGVSDPYDDLFGATVRIASGEQPGDELSYNGTSGDVITIGFRGSDAGYRDALRAVTFKATTPGKRVIELTVDNGSGPGPAAARVIGVSAPPPPGGDGGGGNPPVENPPVENPPITRPPLLRIEDTGAWVAHIRRGRIFRVPGLVLQCPSRAAKACTGNVSVAGAETTTLPVPAGDERGILVRLGHLAKRRLASRRRLTLVAHVSLSLAGSETVRAVKRFRLLPRR
jgi:hypothetical protein